LKIDFAARGLPPGSNYYKYRKKIEKEFKTIYRVFAEKERLPGAETVIIFCNDPYIAGLNREYRGRKGPTDVLSFYYVDHGEVEFYRGSVEEFYLGEIYISLDRAAEQAARRRASLINELRRLVAHGLFHLVGWDHRNRSEELGMRLRERELLRWAQREKKNSRRK